MKKRRQPSPEARLFLAELRAGRREALERLELELREHGGNVSATAAALGITRLPLYRIAREVPEVREVLDAERMGREGAIRVAQKSRENK